MTAVFYSLSIHVYGLCVSVYYIYLFSNDGILDKLYYYIRVLL